MNSTRTATLILWVTLTCLVGFGMFVMKNQVQNLENELASINRNIEEDVKTIHILMEPPEQSVPASCPGNETYFAESGQG